jgi:transcriptional regulator with XRE-family HTH domain
MQQQFHVERSFVLWSGAYSGAMEDYGSRIKLFRKRAKLTQGGLADLLGTTTKTVLCWEKNEHTPDLATMKRIASVLKIKLDLLLSGNYVPVVSDVSAGSFCALPDLQKAQLLHYPADGRDLIAFRVSGQSMNKMGTIYIASR